MKIPFAVLVLLTVSVLFSAFAAGYSDNHGDDTLSGWTVYGKRSWSESYGRAIPNSSDQHCRGFLVNAFPCADNGTFSCRLWGSGDLNSIDGGIVFRFTDTSHYYFVTIAQANATGFSNDNMLRLCKNSTEARENYIVIKNGLDFSGLNSMFDIDIQCSGPTFTFWLNGDSLGQYTDTDNPDGRVGYGYDDITNGYIEVDSSCWVDAINDYTWDLSIDEGIQSGDGIWGFDPYWTVNGGDGTSLTSWVPWRSATFSGDKDDYEIMIDGTLLVDSLAFLQSTYSLSGDTIDLGTNSGVYVDEDNMVIFAAHITGNAGLSKYGGGKLILTGSSDGDGPASIIGGTLQIGDGGTAGTISGTIVNDGTLIFDRTDTITIDEVISGTGKVMMQGTGTLILSAENSWSGETEIAAGCVVIDGEMSTESNVHIDQDAVLAGTGVCAGEVRVDGTISPGGIHPGRLTTGTLRLSSTGVLAVDLGTESDTITVDGTVTLDGKLTITPGSGFGKGIYRILTFTGEVTDEILEVTPVTNGWECTTVLENGYMAVSVTPALIQTEPEDITATIGDTVSFSVSAEGHGSLNYKWLREPTDSVGNGETLTFAVALEDSGARFRCVVEDDFGTDSSRWARLDVVDTTVTDTATRSENPFVLSAAPVSSSSIHLQWHIGEDDTTFTGIRLWYGTKSIDTGIFDQFSEFDSISVAPVETSLVIKGLTPQTRYHFCIQAGTGVSWTKITEKARAECETPAPGNDTAATNPVSIDSLYFDSLAAVFRIEWCLDEVPEEAVEVGIVNGFSDFPATTAGIIPVICPARCTDTIVSLKETIRFDTLYYFNLWFRTAGGVWREPTGRSRKTVRTGSPFRQAVTLFTDDTVSAFNDGILIWKDRDQPQTDSTVDTVETVTYTPFEGMVVVGSPFTLNKAAVGYPVHVGFRIGSIPDALSLSDVRIYYDCSGVCSVEHETVIDSINRIVSVETENLNRTFIAMIDTIRPSIRLFSDTGTFIDASTYPKDSLRISDNITNLRWSYLYNSGDKLPLKCLDDELTTGDTAFSIVVPESSDIKYETTGLRVLLVADDGPHRDTINLSRSVIRSRSDQWVIPEQQWTPVYATSCLNNRDASIFVDQIKKNNDIPEYNPRFMRLFKWVEYEGNMDDSVKWVEYNDKRKNIGTLFTLEPGTVCWMKTHHEEMLSLDTGYTLSLKDTFPVTLPPRRWTDFGMPFHFSVAMEDIISATGKAAESVYWYQWEEDTAHGSYYLKPFYVNVLPDKNNPFGVLVQGGYCFYNPLYDTATLQIPPIPPRMSSEKLRKKTAQTDRSWSARFVAQLEKGGVLPSVYFGYAPGIGKKSLPPAPSFASLRMVAVDQETGERYGHYISDAVGGLCGKLLIVNTADTMQSIDYHFDKVGAFPEQYSCVCYDPEKKKTASSGKLTIAQGETVSRLIVIGDAAYHENLNRKMAASGFFLHTPYPNPSRSLVTIRYSVPFGADERIRIAVYTIKGVKLWERHINQLYAAGEHTLTWHGENTHHTPIGSGNYIIQLIVTDRHHRPLKQFTRYVTLLR